MPLDPHSTPKVNTDITRKQCPIMQGYPLVGVAPELLFDTLGLLHRARQRYSGELVALNLGLTKIYLVSYPNDVQYVLSNKSNNFRKGSSKENSLFDSLFVGFKEVTGDSLPFSDGNIWSRSRRLMQPSFSPKKIAALADDMVVIIAEALSHLEQATPKPSIDIGSEMMQITQSVLLKAIFGSKILQQEAVQAAQAIKKVLKQLQFRTFFFFLPKHLPRPGEPAFKSNISIIRNTVLSIIQNRRASGELSNDMLSLLLQVQDEETQTGIDDQQLVNECVSLFVGGLDTTGKTLTWLWYLLTQHPEVEEKLREEIDAFLGGRLPTFADLAQLKYTRMVIQETMRLYPPSWGRPRMLVEDECINGYPITAGSVLLVCSYMTHRLSEFWEQPEVFNPERFAAEQTEQRHSFAYYPFGGGSRRCIAEHFAMMSMQFIVVMVLQKWRLHYLPGDPVIPEAHSVLVDSRHRIRMTLQRI